MNGWPCARWRASRWRANSVYGTSTKLCSGCGGDHTGKHPDQCKNCMAARSRKWRAANPEKARASVSKYQKSNRERLVKNRRRSHFKATYGITIQQYDELLAGQGGVCAICGTDKPNGPGGKYFMVDHNHETGNVRGLLCGRCNFVLGHSKDRVDVLQKAIAYLNDRGG